MGRLVRSRVKKYSARGSVRPPLWRAGGGRRQTAGSRCERYTEARRRDASIAARSTTRRGGNGRRAGGYFPRAGTRHRTAVSGRPPDADGTRGAGREGGPKPARGKSNEATRGARGVGAH
ncbi:unnamed protein product, partial [Iphiclides podalirius]